MRLAREVVSASALILLLAISADAQSDRATGEECSYDDDCLSGCCGSQVSPAALCLDALAEGLGEECFTTDGCDCEVGQCTGGFCSEDAPSPSTTIEVCDVDNDCDSGCCSLLLDENVCLQKAALSPGEACLTGDGCDCLYGKCVSGICSDCEDDDHCPEDTACCVDGACFEDISDCGSSQTQTPSSFKLPILSPPSSPSPLTKSPTPTATPSPTPGRTTPAPTPTRASAKSSTSTPTQPHRHTWSVVAASVVGVMLLGVLVLTYVKLKMRCAARNRSIRECLEVLCTKGSFWSAMVVLAGIFVALNILNFASMWGIVRAWAAFVLWFVVLAWFVAFKTGTPATESFGIIP